MRLSIRALVLFLGSTLLLTSGGPWAAVRPTATAAATTATTTDSLNLRAGPGLGFDVLLVMPPGAEVAVTGNPEGGFYPVSFAGTGGWAAGDYLSIAGGGGGSQATTTDSLNLRAGPGLGFDVLLVMPPGAGVAITGEPEGGFYPVTFDGADGWASGDYLAFAGGDSGGGSGGSGEATTTYYLNLRAGPGLDAAIQTVMPPGSVVTLTGGSSGEFVAVAYGNLAGWAARAYLDVGSGGGDEGSGGGGGAVGGTATVLDDLYLRAEPNPSAAVLLTMPTGARVELTGNRIANFAELFYGGVRGWGFSTYLDDGDDVNAPAAAAPPSNPFGFAPPAPGSGTAIVTEDAYLRAAASQSAEVQTVLTAGTEVQLTGISQNGFFLVLHNGARGWASSSYLLTGGRPADAYGYSQAMIEGFIVDAAARYGLDADALLAVARCESDLIPQAANAAGAYGLFQFVRSTWESTPYADHDVFEAWANANAAAWMWSVGRRYEWTCR